MILLLLSRTDSMEEFKPVYNYPPLKRFWTTPNLYEIMRDDFKIYDSLLDLGCSGMADILDFEYSPFKKLIGIDKHDVNPFWVYRDAEQKGMTEQEKFQVDNDIERNNDLLDYIFHKFDIRQCRIEDFKFPEAPYAFIICNKVLHFFPDDQKFQLIDRFYEHLQPKGLIYLKINHIGHPDLQNRKNSDLIGEYAVKPKFMNKWGDQDPVYYMVPEKLNAFVSKYETLHKYSELEKSDQHMTVNGSVVFKRSYCQCLSTGCRAFLF